MHMSEQQSLPFPFNSEEAEAQIEQHRRIVNYDVKEYPVEVIVKKFLGETNEDDESSGSLRPEFFIPDYQRDHTWDDKRKSKFIESVLIGLPIPFLFFAEVEDEDETAPLEIVDGSQRVRTLVEFSQNELKLCELEKLTHLNGCTFENLPLGRKRKFNRATIRIIVLSDSADEETRRDLFERINTGSDPLSDMEQRRGIMRGPFTTLLQELATLPLFLELAPISGAKAKRREREEFVLRFFAYSNNYERFEKRVKEFLDEFVRSQNANFNKEAKTHEFVSMLEFVKKYFPDGFRRPQHTTTPRIRFESIAAGVGLALRQKPDLVPPPVGKWANSDEFIELTTSDSSNSRPKVKTRIEFVRDHLLGNQQ